MDFVICVDSIFGCFVRMLLDFLLSLLLINLISFLSLDIGFFVILVIMNDLLDKVVVDVKLFGVID